MKSVSLKPGRQFESGAAFLPLESSIFTVAPFRRKLLDNSYKKQH